MYCKTCKSFRFVDLSFKDLSRFITGGGGEGRVVGWLIYSQFSKSSFILCF